MVALAGVQEWVSVSDSNQFNPRYMKRYLLIAIMLLLGVSVRAQIVGATNNQQAPQDRTTRHSSPIVRDYDKMFFYTGLNGYPYNDYGFLGLDAGIVLSISHSLDNPISPYVGGEVSLWYGVNESFLVPGLTAEVGSLFRFGNNVRLITCWRPQYHFEDICLYGVGVGLLINNIRLLIDYQGSYGIGAHISWVW